MKKARYYLFCMKWLWKNRRWSSTRQKIKALDRAVAEAFGRE